MATITLQEAQSKLGELIYQLVPGAEVVITDNNRPVAKLVPPEPQRCQGPSEPGSAKPRRTLGQQPGSVLYMAPDFDEPLEDFREYME